jgi:hypothetical protein
MTFTFNDDVTAIKRTANDYITNGQNMHKGVLAVLTLFDAGLVNPLEARKLLDQAAAQAVDEAESIRYNLLRLSESWATWTQPDDHTDREQFEKMLANGFYAHADYPAVQ